MAVPSIKRRLAALPYEGLLLLALLLIVSFPAAGMKGAVLSGWPHFLYQTYLLCMAAAYFVWFWCHGGQTLAMKTWRFKVVDQVGAPIRVGRALWRFICALLFFSPACASLVLLFFPTRVNPAITILGFVPLVATILWAKYDIDRQFLHDRLAGTRLVSHTAAI